MGWLASCCRRICALLKFEKRSWTLPGSDRLHQFLWKACKQKPKSLEASTHTRRTCYCFILSRPVPFGDRCLSSTLDAPTKPQEYCPSSYECTPRSRRIFRRLLFDCLAFEALNELSGLWRQILIEATATLYNFLTFWSMSGYDKPQDYFDYDQATRANPDQASYTPYVPPAQAPTFVPQAHHFAPADTPTSQTTVPHGLAPLTQQTQGVPLIGSGEAASYAVPRDTPVAAFTHSTATASHPFIAQDRNRLHSTLELTATESLSGPPGGKLKFSVRSQTSYPVDKYKFYVSFYGNTAISVHPHVVYQAPYHLYTLHLDIPDLTEGANPMMPLTLDIQDENSPYSLEHKELGPFYLQSASSGYQQYTSSQQQLDRKRKFADPSEHYLGGLGQSSAKRTASQPLQPSNEKFKDSSPLYSGHHQPHHMATIQPTGGSPYQTSALYAIPQQNSARLPFAQNLQRAPQQSYGAFSMSPTMAPQSLKVRSPRAVTYGSSAYPPHSLTQGQQSPRQSTASSTSMARSLSTSSNPVLVRTSSMRATPTAFPTMPPASSITYAPASPVAFNPYELYPNTKAVLSIQGDLTSMTHGWSPVERQAKRRIVEFEREQTGSTIVAHFKAVSLESRSPNHPCVSCIWWEEKKACYVTSVDTIALLESLVGVRFTVEEKNRIRRNLEGFKPYTVSKAKTECEDMFKLIMGFPSPKPRNIEKDIKIFPWTILGQALKKIIGKYSASYTSTSAIITTTGAVPGYVATAPEAAGGVAGHTTASSPDSSSSSGVPYQGVGMTPQASAAAGMPVVSNLQLAAGVSSAGSSSLQHYHHAAPPHPGAQHHQQHSQHWAQHQQHSPSYPTPGAGGSLQQYTSAMDSYLASADAGVASVPTSEHTLAYYGSRGGGASSGGDRGTADQAAAGAQQPHQQLRHQQSPRYGSSSGVQQTSRP